MSFLLMVFLTLVCLYDAYPAPPWPGTPEQSVLLTAGVVLLIALHAFWVSRRVSWPLAGNPSLRERVLGRYDRARIVHQMGQFVLYGLTLAVLGWGWAVRDLWKWHGHVLPGVDLLTLLPFLAGQVLTWIFFYDADRAAHRAAYRLLDADPFGQNWLEMRHSVAPFERRGTYVVFQLRQKLALVFIPVLLLVVLKEVLRLFQGNEPEWQTLVNLLGSGAILGVFIAMPLLIRLVLGLKPLPEGRLRARLLAASRRLGFACSDILLWDTRSGMANAMVIGLAPWLRYVVFTDRLIEDFSEDEIEAVFGHEVGHIRHRHMLYYLLFLSLSMAVLGMVAQHYLLPSLGWLGASMGLVDPAVEPTAAPMEGAGPAMFPIVGVVVGYIFLVFGFLSRRCERQADLFGCRAVSCDDPDCLRHFEETTLPARGKGLCATGIRTFIRALEKVAVVNGISRDRPGFLQSWQHSTIARRVTFLQDVLADARIETAFQRRLKALQWVMMLVLAGVFAGLVHVYGWQ